MSKQDDVSMEQEEEQKKVTKYEFRVDNLKFETQQSELTGREILLVANKTPYDRFRLDMRLKGGGRERIAYDQVVDLSAPGLERFTTLPLDQTEGGKTNR